MFNSQSLLSKKGALGSIWTAAHCAKRLKKEQVFLTDISSSVVMNAAELDRLMDEQDKILLDEFPVVTYRILAFLLLGLVRIYSKKVEYLFHDCRDVLSELRHFVISKKSNNPIEVICAPYLSFTVPERFELDAFDLEVAETSSGDHTTPWEGITRKGNKEGIWLQPVEQYHSEDALQFEDFSAGHTPIKDIFSPYSTTIDVVASTSHNLSNMVEGSRKKLRNKRFSLEECLPPMLFDEAEEAADPGRTFREEQQKNEEELKSLHSPMVIGDDAECEDYVQSFDKKHENQEQTHFPNLAALESEKGEGPEDRKSKFHEELQTNGEALNSFPSLMLIGDEEEREDRVHSCNEQHANMEQTNFPYLTAPDSKKGGEAEDPVRTLHKEDQPNGEELKCPHSLMMVGDDVEPDDYVKSIDGKQANLERAKLSELTALDNKKIQTTAKERLISVFISVTPDSKAPHAAGATTPEFLGTRTPATKERVTARVLKKRKCIYDELIVIPNNVYKENIANSRDLVKKRRKLHGEHLNKSNPMSNLPKIFFEPLIPCICVNFQSLICEKQQKTPEPNETVETPTKIDELGSLMVNRRQEEKEAIAPSTPVTHSISLRFTDVRGKTNSERVGPARSFESVGKDPSRSEDREFDLILMNEEETNSSDGDSREKNNWSARTRAVASYLHKIFLARKKRGADEIVKLSQILIGKTKRESARLFHELLVLKTGAFVNVSQDKAYDDISVMETTKLKQSL